MELFYAPQSYAWILNFAKQLTDAENSDTDKVTHQINTRLFNNAFCGLIKNGYAYTYTNEDEINPLMMRIDVNNVVYTCPAKTVANILREPKYATPDSDGEAIETESADRKNEEKEEKLPSVDFELESNAASEENSSTIEAVKSESAEDKSIALPTGDEEPPASEAAVTEEALDNREADAETKAKEVVESKASEADAIEIKEPETVKEDETADNKQETDKESLPSVKSSAEERENDEICSSVEVDTSTEPMQEEPEKVLDFEKAKLFYSKTQSCLDRIGMMGIAPLYNFVPDLKQYADPIHIKNLNSKKEIPENEEMRIVAKIFKSQGIKERDIQQLWELYRNCLITEAKTTDEADENNSVDMEAVSTDVEKSEREAEQQTIEAPQIEKNLEDADISAEKAEEKSTDGENEEEPAEIEKSVKREILTEPFNDIESSEFDEDDFDESDEEVPEMEDTDEDERDIDISIFQPKFPPKDSLPAIPAPITTNAEIDNEKASKHKSKEKKKSGGLFGGLFKKNKKEKEEIPVFMPNNANEENASKEEPAAPKEIAPIAEEKPEESSFEYAKSGGELFQHTHNIILKPKLGDVECGKCRIIVYPIHVIEQSPRKMWAPILVHVLDGNGNEQVLCTNKNEGQIKIKTTDKEEYTVCGIWDNGVFNSYVYLAGNTDSKKRMEETIDKLEPSHIEDRFLDQFRERKKGSPTLFVVPLRKQNYGERNIPIIGYASYAGDRYPLERREGNMLRYRHNHNDRVIKGHWENDGFKFKSEDATEIDWSDITDE